MAGKSTVFTDPAMEAFVRETGPQVGWGTLKQFAEWEKVWPGLVSADAFRMFAQRMRRGSHISLPKDAKVLAQTYGEAMEDHRRELEARAQHRIMDELMTKQTRTEQILEVVSSTIRSIPPKTIRLWSPPKPTSDTPQDCIILLSDVQAGQKVIPTEIAGFNEYNREVLLRRFDRFERATHEIIRHQQSAFPVERVTLLSLGDLVEGDRIYKSQRFYIDQDMHQQWLGMAHRLSEYLIRLLQVVPEVIVHAVPGNHGRIGDKGDNKTYVNWDTIVMDTVKILCKDYPQITFNVPESFFIITEIGGHNWLIYHGDDIKSWAGIPWYGIQRAIGEWIQIFNTLGKTFEYAAQGHFHREAKIDVAAGEVFINGNWVGTNEHSLHMRAVGMPKQTMLFSHPQYGITSRHPIFLEQPWA